MEISTIASNQFAIFLPVAVVIVFAFLVFAFGFKSSVEPPSFKHISFTADEKKTIKKKKVKDKKPQTNGHATVVIDVPDTKKSDGAQKVGKQGNKVETPKQKKVADGEKPEKKLEPQKSPVKKEKKSEGKKKDVIEKPADFDDGEWETAPSRKDKKKKKDEDIISAITPEKLAKKKAPASKKEKVEDSLKAETKIEETPPKVVVVEEATPAEIAKNPSDDLPADTPTLVTPPPPAQPPTDAKQSEPESAEEQINKKKKAKKGKSSLPEDDAVVPEVEQVAASSVEVTESPQAFNELEDSWKDAPQRKSKKKVRKD